MLLRFGVANHLSIRSYQELSFAASTLSDRRDGLIACTAVPSGAVLPAILVYGANASGKSNLVAALGAMREAVLLSHAHGEPGGGVPRDPFRLDAACAECPSRFDIDFVLKAVRYHYGFEVSDAAFEKEWLYAFLESRRRTLFERDGGEFRFGRELKGRNRVIADLTRPNSLFVSAAAQNGHERLSTIYEFFQSVRGDQNIAVGGRRASALMPADGPDDRVIAFLERAETGIVGYRRTETEFPDELRTLQREIAAVAQRVLKKPIVTPGSEPDDKLVAVELAHLDAGGKEVYFDLDRESAGTRRLLVMLDRACFALDTGAPMVVDELDASLHTRAAKAVLDLFCSPATNPKGAQLIATTHDTNLMKPSVLRRDQLWFVELGLDGATRLYPLTDIRTRKDDNIEKGYLQGRYGAVPSIDDSIPTLGATG